MKYSTLIMYGCGIVGSSISGLMSRFQVGISIWEIPAIIIGIMLFHIGITGGLKQ